MCLLGLVSTDLGIPFILTKDKISPDIQTCYKVVSGGTAYSTLSFHDNVDTGSLSQFYIQLVNRPRFGTGILLFGPCGQSGQ